MNPAFAIGQQVGTNFGKAFKDVQETSMLDKILAESMQSQDPNVLQNNLTKILSSVSPERQPQAIKFLESRLENIAQQKQSQALQKRGIDPNLPADIRKLEYENQMYQNQAQSVFNPQSSGQVSNPIVPSEGQPMQAQQPADANQINWSSLSDEQLVKLRGIPPFAKQADAEQNRRTESAKIEQKKGSDLFKSQLARSDKIISEADQIAAQLPKKKTALALQKDAIANKDLSFWSKDNLAEITGIEGLRSPEGAIFKTAGKEYFLGNISRAGARPNQWIEQQIADMMAKIGRDTSANLAVTRALENEVDLDEKRVEFTNEIADRLEAEGDLSKSKLSRELSSRMAQYATEKQDELFNDLRALKAIDEKKPQKFRPVKKGSKVSPYVVQALLLTFKNDPVKAEQEARKLGYEL